MLFDKRVGFFLVILVGFFFGLGTLSGDVLTKPPIGAVSLVDPPAEEQPDSDETESDGENEDSSEEKEDKAKKGKKRSLGDFFKRSGKKKERKGDQSDSEKKTDGAEPAEKSGETQEEIEKDGEKNARTADDSDREKTEQAEDEQEDDEEDKSSTPQVEVYVPSVLALAEAFKASKTATLFEAVSGIIPKPRQESDEDFDIGALFQLIEKISGWPDTSLAFTTYTQDRQGRPRWALKVDWSLEDFASHLEDLLNDDAAAKILENVRLLENENGTYRLELPDLVLAVLSEADEGSMIASATDFQPPELVYGQESAEEKAKGKAKKKSLVYCRLNLDAGDEDEKGSSFFSQLAGVSDIRYRASLRKSGRWSERWGVVWNPLVGGFLKTVLQKAKKSFECPKDAYFVAVVNVGLGGGGPDGLAGLPYGTIGLRTHSEIAFAVVPGSGFLPIPDTFYQFRAKKKKAIIEDIRKFIAKDSKKRAQDDRPPAWYEEKIDGRVVFWKDPSADRYGGLMPSSNRSVIFFQDTGDDESKKTYLIIANTSTWAEDIVRRWNELRKDTIELPTSKKVHWQARVHWKEIYALARPYLSILASFSDESDIPPAAAEIKDALANSKIDFKITAGGLRVVHTGPIPLGAAYVPTLAMVSLGSTADPSSEAARERTACRHLRVLYHHSKLFKKDFGRWPATVAELDGYVDFATHARLLSLRPRERTFAEGLVSIFATKEKKPDNEDEQEEEESIDDSLYVIDWFEDEAEWKLKFRDGEFNKYNTIYIDAEGEIHRVEKDDSETKDDAEKAKKDSSEKKRQVAL